MCLDGPANSVYEVDAVPVPAGPANPYGNAFTVQETLLETESAAQRMAAPRAEPVLEDRQPRRAQRLR